MENDTKTISVRELGYKSSKETSATAHLIRDSLDIGHQGRRLRLTTAWTQLTQAPWDVVQVGDRQWRKQRQTDKLQGDRRRLQWWLNHSNEQHNN